jgi:hypothetical protein
MDNTQLPAEVSSKIELQAHDAASSLYSPNNYNEFTSYQSGYAKGATEYATKLHQANKDKLNLQMTIKGIEDQLTVERGKHNAARILLSKVYDDFIGATEMSENNTDKKLFKQIKQFLDGTK